MIRVGDLGILVYWNLPFHEEPPFFSYQPSSSKFLIIGKFPGQTTSAEKWHIKHSNVLLIFEVIQKLLGVIASILGRLDTESHDSIEAVASEPEVAEFMTVGGEDTISLREFL